MKRGGVRIIGVDCATDPRKVGLALAQLDGSKARMLAAERGSDSSSVAGRIAEWMGADRRVLLALDAPLGWPLGLGDTLARHSAGEVVTTEPNRLFRRLTDRVVFAEIGKLPLDVGADRIARTAVAALDLLERLRALTGRAIPLAWGPGICDAEAIEVYPAGTLAALGVRSTGYKAPDQLERRREILGVLERRIELVGDGHALLENADILDAGLCVLAALDFLDGEVIEPENPEVARREGWIWVRPPSIARPSRRGSGPPNGTRAPE